MVRRHTAYWAYGLLLLLASSAVAHGASGDSDYSAPDSSSSGDKESSGTSGGSTEELCDPYKQTKSPRIAIVWKDRPDNCPGFFEKWNIGLEMLYEWGEEATIYEAEDTKDANNILEDILTILSGDDLTGYGPFADPDIQHAIKAHVKLVYGECFWVGFAPQPAEVPTECGRGLPDACPERLWGLNRIRAPPVWNSLPGVVNANPSSTVMVIDSGINEVHQDLASNLVPALTVTGYTNPPQPVSSGNAAPPLTDPQGHGTHVAGTVFARWNNGANTPVGVVGRALGGSCGCAVRNPQTAEERRSMEGFCLINCLRFAADRGVRVINLSWGGPVPTRATVDDPFRTSIVGFCNTGGIVAIAAGNDAQNNIQPNRFVYPSVFATDLAATHPTCIITVANLQQDGAFNPTSSWGANVKVAAPGTDIFSTYIGSTTATEVFFGTSMASPHVAGIATLLFNAFPGATQAQVHNCIVNTATVRVRPNPAVPGQTIAGGIVNLEAAYTCLRGNPTCPSTGLPPCVDSNSGQPVEACDASGNRFCRPIPGNTRFLCQYNFRPEGALCVRNTTANTASLDAGIFEELSAEEIQTLGLPATPTAEYLEADIVGQAQLMGRSEAQQNRRTKTKPNIRTCGQCVNRQCVAATAKWCKTAEKRAQQATTTSAAPST